MHSCSMRQCTALVLFVLQDSMLLLHCQICPLCCMCFVVQFCTQMAQLTRLHNILNLHKTSLLLIDAYKQTASFYSMTAPRGNQTSRLFTHDTVCLLT